MSAQALPVRARPPSPLSSAALVSSFDRFAVSPLLVLVAADLGVSLSQALVVASGYFLAYGLCQPMWGVLSDRFGRVRLMQTMLIMGAVTGIFSAVAPSIGVLVAARALTGAFYGAIVPTSMTYVGDTVGEEHRQSALADLMAAVAVGAALATAAAGGVADLVSWRVVFAVPSVLALGCAYTLRRLPEPRRDVGHGLVAKVRDAVRNRWVLAVLSLALVEGGVVLGVLTLLAPALQSQGVDAATAGLATAAYGVSVILATRAVKVVARRVQMSGLMAIGGVAVVSAYAAVALHVSVATVVAAALLLGVTWAFLHSSLQTWATAVMPHARGTVVSLFATSLFAGSSFAAWAAGVLGEHDQWALLFGVTATVAFLLTAAAVLASNAYRTRKRA